MSKQAPPRLADMPKLSAGERQFLAVGDKIAAIKAYRQRTGYGLYDSKQVIDHPEITGKTGLDVMLDQIGVLFTKAEVLAGEGTDLIIVTTTAPNPFTPTNGDWSPLRVRFEVPSGMGVAYCREHFGLHAESR